MSDSVSRDEEWGDLRDVVLQRRQTLEGWNSLHVRNYKWLGYVLSVAMPLLAALVTFLSTQSSRALVLSASIIGIVLTFLTVLNAVLKPGERFLSAVQLSHDLEEFKVDVDIDLRKLSRSERPNVEEIWKLLHKRNRQLSAIGEAMARGTLSTNEPEREKRE